MNRKWIIRIALAALLLVGSMLIACEPRQVNYVILEAPPTTPTPPLSSGQIVIDAYARTQHDSRVKGYPLGQYRDYYRAWGNAKFINLEGNIEVALGVGDRIYCKRTVTPENPNFSCETEWTREYMNNAAIVVWGCKTDKTDAIYESFPYSSQPVSCEYTLDAQ